MNGVRAANLFSSTYYQKHYTRCRAARGLYSRMISEKLVARRSTELPDLPEKRGVIRVLRKIQIRIHHTIPNAFLFLLDRIMSCEESLLNCIQDTLYLLPPTYCRGQHSPNLSGFLLPYYTIILPEYKAFYFDSLFSVSSEYAFPRIIHNEGDRFS